MSREGIEPICGGIDFCFFAEVRCTLQCKIAALASHQQDETSEFNKGKTAEARGSGTVNG